MMLLQGHRVIFSAVKEACHNKNLFYKKKVRCNLRSLKMFVCREQDRLIQQRFQTIFSLHIAFQKYKKKISTNRTSSFPHPLILQSLAQQHSLRSVLENRSSEICRQNPSAKPMAKFISSKTAGCLLLHLGTFRTVTCKNNFFPRAPSVVDSVYRNVTIKVQL